MVLRRCRRRRWGRLGGAGRNGRPERAGLRVGDPGLPELGHSPRPPVVEIPHFRRQRGAWIAVIKHHVRATGQAGDEGQSGPYRFLFQVGNDSQPTKKTWAPPDRNPPPPGRQPKSPVQNRAVQKSMIRATESLHPAGIGVSMPGWRGDRPRKCAGGCRRGTGTRRCPARRPAPPVGVFRSQMRPSGNPRRSASASSINCRRNSGGYGGRFFDIADS